MSDGVGGRGGGGPPDGDREGGDDHSDGGAGSPHASTFEAGPGAARSTKGAVGAVDLLEERLDMAGFGLDFLSLGRLSRCRDALNSLDSADLNVLAGFAPVPPRPKFNAAEDCGGASAETRTNGPSPGTVVDGDAESGAARVAAIRAVPRPAAIAGDPAGDICAEREATLHREPDRTDRDSCGSLEALRPREVRPNVETGTLQRRPIDFRTIPITCTSTVPELGLHLIRSKFASMRTSGAHVFRVVAPVLRPVPGRAPKRLVRDKVKVRIQSLPKLPTIVSDTFRPRRAMDRSVKGRELQKQLPAEGQKWMSASRLSARIEESTNAMISQYKDLTASRFLRNVNDANVTWVREVTSAGHEKAVLGPGKPYPIDVYYFLDFSPDNEDECSRSLGDSACKAAVDQSFPTDRLQNPRTLNHHSMLGAGSTCEGVNTN